MDFTPKNFSLFELIDRKLILELELIEFEEHYTICPFIFACCKLSSKINLDLGPISIEEYLNAKKVFNCKNVNKLLNMALYFSKDRFLYQLENKLLKEEDTFVLKQFEFILFYSNFFSRFSEKIENKIFVLFLSRLIVKNQKLVKSYSCYLSFAKCLFSLENKSIFLVLIDCRKKRKFKRSHIKGALNINQKDILFDLFFSKKLLGTQSLINLFNVLKDKCINLKLLERKRTKQLNKKTKQNKKNNFFKNILIIFYWKDDSGCVQEMFDFFCISNDSEFNNYEIKYPNACILKHGFNRFKNDFLFFCKKEEKKNQKIESEKTNLDNKSKELKISWKPYSKEKTDNKKKSRSLEIKKLTTYVKKMQIDQKEDAGKKY